MFGVYSVGGSIGSKGANSVNLGGGKFGKLVKEFDNKADAKAKAARLRKTVTPGERKYFGITYLAREIK